MRRQFLIPENEVYLNNGTVGSSPAPVLRAVFEGYEACEKLNEADPEDYPIWGYASWNQFRDPSGNPAAPQARTVNVVDTTAPIITANPNARP